MSSNYYIELYKSDTKCFKCGNIQYIETCIGIDSTDDFYDETQWVLENQYCNSCGKEITQEDFDKYNSYLLGSMITIEQNEHLKNNNKGKQNG